MFTTKNGGTLSSLFEIAKNLCGHMNNYVSILVKFIDKKILDTIYYW